MKRTLALFLTCVMLLGCMIGCAANTSTSDPKEPANTQGAGTEPGSQGEPSAPTGPVEVNYSINGEPRTIDSVYGTNIVTWDLVRHMQEGLLRLDADGKNLVPGIAEKYEVSENNTKYTFHLRDTCWSDGTPVTAHDFEYSWKLTLTPETGARYLTTLFVLKNAEKYNAGECSADEVGVKALDDKTLEVTTEYYDPMFLHKLTLCQYMPINQAYHEAQGENYAMEAANIICSGPWMLTEWKHQESLRMEKNPYYYNHDAIKIDVINWPIVGETSTAYNMFVSGELDSTGVSGLAETAQAQQAGYEIKFTPTGVTAFVDINQAANEALANLNFRKALMYSIDRASFLTAVYGDQLLPATGLNVPGIYFKDIDYHEYTGDFIADGQIELAKECMAAALQELGYSDVSQVPQMSLLISGDNDQDGAFLQEQWKNNLGLNIEVVNLQSSAKNELYYNGDFDLSLTLFGYDYPYPSSILTMWLPDHKLYESMWSSDEFVELYNTSCYSLDDQEKLDSIVAMEKLMMDEAVCVPYYFTQRAMVTSPRIKGDIRNDNANLYLYYAEVVE